MVIQLPLIEPGIRKHRLWTKCDQPLRGEINYPYRYFSFIYFSIHPFFFFYLFFISLIISEQWSYAAI